MGAGRLLICMIGGECLGAGRLRICMVRCGMQSWPACLPASHSSAACCASWPACFTLICMMHVSMCVNVAGSGHACPPVPPCRCVQVCVVRLGAGVPVPGCGRPLVAHHPGPPGPATAAARLLAQGAGLPGPGQWPERGHGRGRGLQGGLAGVAATPVPLSDGTTSCILVPCILVPYILVSYILVPIILVMVPHHSAIILVSCILVPIIPTPCIMVPCLHHGTTYPTILVPTCQPPLPVRRAGPPHHQPTMHGTCHGTNHAAPHQPTMHGTICLGTNQPMHGTVCRPHAGTTEQASSGSGTTGQAGSGSGSSSDPPRNKCIFSFFHLSECIEPVHPVHRTDPHRTDTLERDCSE